MAEDEVRGALDGPGTDQFWGVWGGALCLEDVATVGVDCDAC